MEKVFVGFTIGLYRVGREAGEAEVFPASIGRTSQPFGLSRPPVRGDGVAPPFGGETRKTQWSYNYFSYTAGNSRGRNRELF